MARFKIDKFGKESFKKLSTFCKLTGAHGLSYTVTGRNLVETLFWILTVTISISWATYNCYTAFVAFSKAPVILLVETFKYEASNVPFPAITFCPQQSLDELHVASVLLNRIKFRCKADSFALLDLEQCD